MTKYISKINGYQLADLKARQTLKDLSPVAFSGDYNDLNNKPDELPELPPATANKSGGVKVGVGLFMDENDRLNAVPTNIVVNESSKLINTKYHVFQLSENYIELPDLTEGQTFAEFFVLINIPQDSDIQLNGFAFPNVYWQMKPQLTYDTDYIYYFAFIHNKWVGTYIKYKNN